MCALAAAVSFVPTAWGFVLGGPINNEPIAPYQVPVIAYGLPGDIVAPKNINEEYRRTTPVMYYAFDQNFLEFFGSNGVAAVDQAFTILNTVTNLSRFSPDLSEFPQNSRRVNYSAEALSLVDLRSTTLGLMTEQLGLAEPVRYLWCLHNRFIPTGNPACPAGEVYTVIQRNFPVVPSPLNQLQYSSYVNGTLYSYFIREFCTGPDPLADAVEFAVDPVANQFTAVADYVSQWYIGLPVGSFYTYLTRDDVGGMRYLMGTNNFNFENSGLNTVQFVTNNTQQILTTQDLGLLIAQSKTNSAATLQALYPGLIVNQLGNGFGLAITTNITQVIVPAPLSPAGFVQVKNVTIITTNVVQFFTNTFANVVTNFYSPKTFYQVQTVSPGAAPFSPAGSPPTLQTSTKNYTITQPSGDFFILPAGLCAINILNSNLLPTTVITTNLISTTTSTNATGSNQTFTVSTVTYFTNHVIVYLPVTCPPNTVEQRQGNNGVQFVRRDFDSLIGTFWAPVTNEYTIMSLTNNTLIPEAFQRTVIRPDILFSAADLDSGPANPLNLALEFVRNINLNQANRLPQLAGPGTIESPSLVTFNKSTPIYLNLPTEGAHGFLLTELTHAPIVFWGSFDGTTNDPVVYPNGTSLVNLQNMLLIQVLPQAGALPGGKVGVAYSFNSFSVTGGQAPYTWSLSPNTPGGLPPGLNPVDPTTGSITGTPSGSPFISVTYDFIIRLTDAGGRFVDVPYSITIHP